MLSIWSALAGPANPCLAPIVIRPLRALLACSRLAPAGSMLRSPWPANRIQPRCRGSLGSSFKGALPDWVSAKDVVLEMLRRHGVSGGLGKIIEYYGPGLQCLSAMDRHVIANMGAELGATTSVFPSDEETKRFLESRGRAEEWREVKADRGCDYDDHDEIDLSKLEPLIAKPSSPGNVVAVKDVEGEEIYQAYIGSSANPGWRDFAIASEIVRGKTIPAKVSFDVNPTSRQILRH